MHSSFENVTAFKSTNEKFDYRFTGKFCVLRDKFCSFPLASANTCSKIFRKKNRICTYGALKGFSLFSSNSHDSQTINHLHFARN